MQLYIGNKNYSSWSLRAWLLLRQFNIPFEEITLRFDGFGPESQFKQRALQLSPTGRVPVLVDGPLVVWDTLAIAETVAERFPQLALWPRDSLQRARARSLCAEMHAGFSALRTHCPMNIEISFPEIGSRLMREQPEVVADLQRITDIVTTELRRSGGPFLFSQFSIADAFYAPVLSRIKTYALPAPASLAVYSQAVFATPAMSEWVSAALAERDFVAEDEPYRQRP